MASVFRKIGIYHHPAQAAAQALAQEIAQRLRETVPEVWVASAWDPETSTKDLPQTEVLICIGGDGTVLRGARAVVPYPTAILGVDVGRLAFLTEVTPDALRDRLPDLLAGNYRVEERAMLDVDFSNFAGVDTPKFGNALNDVILGRTSLGRPVYINVKVNGDLIGVIRADAIVIATATGSTGYSLSAGGPILDPLSRSLVVTPVAPHLAAAVPLVLPQDTVVELASASDGNVAVSVDGQGQHLMGLGSTITVRRSPHVARMIRFADKPFFAQLGRRLSWLDERRLKAVSEGQPDPNDHLSADDRYRAEDARVD